MRLHSIRNIMNSLVFWFTNRAALKNKSKYEPGYLNFAHKKSPGSGNTIALHWRHNDHDCVSNYQSRGCLLNCLFGRKSKKTSMLRVTGLCVGNSPGPVNSPHKGPVTRKMFPFDDVIMINHDCNQYRHDVWLCDHHWFRCCYPCTTLNLHRLRGKWLVLYIYGVYTPVIIANIDSDIGLSPVWP